MKNLGKAQERMKLQHETPAETVFAKMNAMGVELNEERFIHDYAEIHNVRKLDDQYYAQYGEILDCEHPEQWVNSDMITILLDRIIPEHFDFEETGDPYFIAQTAAQLAEKDPKTYPQTETEKIFRALITCSKKHDIHMLNELSDYYDMNFILGILCRNCRFRNTAFREMIKEFYRCYEDADPKIFMNAYREVQSERKN